MDGLAIHIDRVDIAQLVVEGCPRPTFDWHVGPMLPKEAPMPLEITMSTEEKSRVRVNPRTPAGNPGALDGAAVFSVMEGTCTVEVIDEASVWILAGDLPGDTVVMVEGDADLGAGIVPIKDTVLVHVEHAQAQQFGLTADAPELK